MRCKHCGAEIIRIQTMGGPAICWASPTIYWPVRDNEARELLTPNGSSVYGNLTGELQDAVGIGYLPHTCYQMLLILQGRDSWDRPVYKGPDGNLYVDVDPRKGWGPNIDPVRGRHSHVSGNAEGERRGVPLYWLLGG